MKLNDTIIIPFPTEAVFGEMYAKFAAPLVNQLRHSCNSKADCEDAVQVSCAYLIDHFEKISSYNKKQAASYVVLLVRSRSRDIRDRRKEMVYGDIDQYTDLIVDYPEANRSLSLREAFSLLPERYQEALTLFYYDDLSIKEMAELLRSSEGAVRKLLQRARDALRDRMTAKEGADEC